MAMCRGMCTHATWATFTSMSPGPPHEWFMVGVVKMYVIWSMECIDDMCIAGRHHMCLGDDHGWPPFGPSTTYHGPAVSQHASHVLTLLVRLNET